MEHCFNFLLPQYLCHQRCISDIADNKVSIYHGIGKTGAQVVQHDHVLAGRNELKDNVTADIACASSH